MQRSTGNATHTNVKYNKLSLDDDNDGVNRKRKRTNHARATTLTVVADDPNDMIPIIRSTQNSDVDDDDNSDVDDKSVCVLNNERNDKKISYYAHT